MTAPLPSSFFFDGSGVWSPTSASSVEFWGGPAASITGTLTSIGSNQPIANCKVWTEDLPDTAYTDSWGVYGLGVEPGGPYTVRFHEETHCDTSVTGVEVGTESPDTVDMRMAAPVGQVDETSVNMGPVWHGHDAVGYIHLSNPGGQCP